MINIKIQREPFLKALQMVAAVVERRPTVPILSHVLFSIENNQLSLTATDLEVQITVNVATSEPTAPAKMTVPARKLVDICRALNQDIIELVQQEQRLLVKSGRGKYSLSILPANDFPYAEEEDSIAQGYLAKDTLSKLFDKTHFAIAQQDARLYLNGLFLGAKDKQLVAVSTNAHRIAVAKTDLPGEHSFEFNIIIPRKSIYELMKLLALLPDQRLAIKVGASHIQISGDAFVFGSKLIDAQFPDYRRLIPPEGKRTFIANKEDLRNLLTRAVVFSDQELPVVCFDLTHNLLKAKIMNRDQEEAEDEMEIDYQGEVATFCFNAVYLLDGLSIIEGDDVKFIFSDAGTPVLLSALAETNHIYAVMPMAV
jgi:DNA polymerase III subunit beta